MLYIYIILFGEVTSTTNGTIHIIGSLLTKNIYSLVKNKLIKKEIVYTAIREHRVTSMYYWHQL